MIESVQSFKVIVALKSSKDLKSGTIRCAIQINDKVKFTILPQSEGQFFDINDLSIGIPITIMFDVQSTGQRIGDLQIQIPATIYQSREVEIADTFTIDYQNELNQNESFSGRYYIIILNKGEILLNHKEKQNFQQKVQQSHETRQQSSPTKQYIKSTGERTQERAKKEKSLKLLAETKYDPKQQRQKQDKNDNKKYSPSMSKIKPINSKPKKESIQSLNKYNSQKQIENDKEVRQFSPIIQIVDQEQQISIQKQCDSPFARYRGSSNPAAEISKYSGGQNEEFNGRLSLQQTDMSREETKEFNENILKNVDDLENKISELQQEIIQGEHEQDQNKIDLQVQINDLRQKNDDILQDKYLINTQLQEVQSELNRKKLQIKELQQKYEDLENQNNMSRDKEQVTSQFKQKQEIMEQQLQRQQTQFQDQSKKLLNIIEKLEVQIIELQKEKESKDQLNIQTLQKLQKTTEANQILENRLQQLKNDLGFSNSKICNTEGLKQQTQILQNQLNDRQQKLQNCEEDNQMLRQELLKLEETLKKQQIIHDKQLELIRQDLKTKSQNYFQIQAENQQLQLEISQYDDNKIQEKIFKKQYDQLVKKNNQLEDQNQLMVNENNNLSSKIVELSDSLQTTNNQILELREQIVQMSSTIEQVESNNNNLKKLILQMRERGVVYVPIQDDDIDNKLATFINSKDDGDKFRQLFVREGAGVYQFGQKRIYMKLEQDKILIRTGGGYLSLEEFLNLYSQREVESSLRGDPMAVLQRNKAVLRRTDQMKLVNKIKDKDESISPAIRKKIQNYD